MIVAAGCAALLLGAPPAGAGEAAAAGFPLRLDPSPPADTGKPQLFVPAPVAAPSAGCAAVFDCRLRVIGAIRRNGAVELNAGILKW